MQHCSQFLFLKSNQKHKYPLLAKSAWLGAIFKCQRCWKHGCCCDTVFQARILADPPCVVARMARWDEAAEPFRLEIPMATTKDVLAILERLYVCPRAEAWRVKDVASGFRKAAV